MPKEIFESGKPLSVFGRLFGDRSSEYAIELLKEALKQEEDEEVNIEIGKRIRLLQAKRPKIEMQFMQRSIRRMTQNKHERGLY